MRYTVYNKAINVQFFKQMTLKKPLTIHAATQESQDDTAYTMTN